ncbi:N-acetylglucosaminyl deacetylase, LmbE family [Austwickia chelonae]|uniref:Hydrolase n=1 Tax=Austwickia chelonae NBRC 105200 TaxID=1184607 RepID=K6W9A9_9MICO|nr:PIG-L deacetylase family protein [Austwickia chelonae]GAB78432.1 hypothetical protein AUCHE_09_00380 [Austwickia chelonae NBRC 105200]SEW39469.1 N-acetylglucosaminyl deacetylase, LmbE family [Austwickia chelonae]
MDASEVSGEDRHELPRWARVLVVVAHPDDESFGLGGLIEAFTGTGARVHVLCLTRGEASTLGGDAYPDLAAVRQQELETAGRELGVDGVTLLSYPDGALGGIPVEELVAVVGRAVDGHGPEGLLVFDDDGVTGHPDHCAATAAAVHAAAARALPVLAWTMPVEVAEELNRSFGTAISGRSREQVDLVVRCPRERQLRAVHAHTSQAVPGSPLWRRLELCGDVEWVRFLTRG